MVCNTIRSSSSHTRSFFRCILNSYVYSCPFLDIQPPLIMERFISKSHFTGVLALQFGKNWTLDLLDSSLALILLLLKGESVIFAQPIAKVVKKKSESPSCYVMCNSLWPHGLLSCQALLSMEFSRNEYWNGSLFPSPGDLADPGVETGSPALQADSLLSEPLGMHQKQILKIHLVNQKPPCRCFSVTIACDRHWITIIWW